MHERFLGMADDLVRTSGLMMYQMMMLVVPSGLRMIMNEEGTLVNYDYSPSHTEVMAPDRGLRPPFHLRLQWRTAQAYLDRR